MSVGESHRPDDAAFLDRRAQHRRLSLSQRLGDVCDLQVVAEIRFIGAVLQKAFLHVDARERDGQVDRQQLFPDLGPQSLDERKDVLLGAEGHLDVELCDLHHAVRAQVLVAQAARDLVVATDPRHHQELLQLLRRLRQGEELTGMQS